MLTSLEIHTNQPQLAPQGCWTRLLIFPGWLTLSTVTTPNLSVSAKPTGSLHSVGKAASSQTEPIRLGQADFLGVCCLLLSVACSDSPLGSHPSPVFSTIGIRSLLRLRVLDSLGFLPGLSCLPPFSWSPLSSLLTNIFGFFFSF